MSFEELDDEARSARTRARRERERLRSFIFAMSLLGGLTIAACVAVFFVVKKTARVAEQNRPPRVEPDSPAEPEPPPAQKGVRVVWQESDPAEVDEEISITSRELIRLGISVCYLSVVILLAVWVVKDCRNRSVDSGVLWMIVVLVTCWLGLIIYLASRPQGMLIRCERCGNRRLPYVGVCPHCHQVVKSRGRAGNTLV